MKTFPVVILGVLVALLKPFDPRAGISAERPPNSLAASTQPPARWAPAHLYRYFPEQEVYFDPQKGTYFYSEAGAWRADTCLPASMKIDGTAFIELGMDANAPYEFHRDVKAAFPNAAAADSTSRAARGEVDHANSRG